MYTLHCIQALIGERAKRARHSQVCSIENRDICIYYSTYVCHTCPLTLSDHALYVTRKEGGA